MKPLERSRFASSPAARVLERKPSLVIGLAGPIGAGKSTAAASLVRRVGGEVLPFAAPLKRMLAALGVPARNLYGSPAEKTEPLPLLGGQSARRAMQTLGTEWGRELISPTLWIDAWTAAALAARGPVIADDVRFAGEADAVRALGGIVVLVRRPDGAPPPESSPGHASEALDLVADVTLDNAGSKVALGKALRAALDARGLLGPR